MMVFSTSKILIGLLAFWLIVIVMLSGPLFQNNEPNDQILTRLSRAVGELEALKVQNDEIRSLLNILKFPPDMKNDIIQQLEGASKAPKKLVHCTDTKEPSKDFEETRRLIENGITEMWYYVKSEFKKLNKSLPSSGKVISIDSILRNIAGHRRSLLHNMHKLKDLDGFDEWRAQESEDLSNLVQQRLHHLQNPKDCSSAKKLICNLNKGCGYGCQIHHAVYCFIVAYGTKRTLILRSHNWRYAQKGWESVFLPLSETCKDDSGKNRAPWPGTEDTQVLDLPIIDNVQPRPPFIPLAVPRDLSDRILRLHGNPTVWWIAQFLKYLLRPQESMKKTLQQVEEKMDFKHPVVGIHVRRTDKIGTEAAFHSIEEYMEYAEEYYQQLEMARPGQIRRVYLATDDPNLLTESKKKYPKYTFYGDPTIAKSAAVVNRYSTESLKGVIIDIHMLSKCDYIVCTFSSQVCRLAYEIMQNYHPDASFNFHSLDDIFYFGGQNDHNQVAVYNHTPNSANEIEMVKGDIIGIAGNHWNGFSKGINRRTKKSGLYPSYKAVEKIDIVDFPTYIEVDENS